MNLLVFSAYYEPEKVSSLFLSKDLYEGLAQLKINITLIVPLPTRGVDRVTRNTYKKKKEVKCEGNLRIKRVYVPNEKKSIILRFLRYLFLCGTFIIHGLFIKSDAIFVQSTPPIQGAMAVILKKIKKIPLVYNLQDIFPDSMANMKMIKKGGHIWNIGRIIESYTYKNCDKIIVISNSMKQNILQKGVGENKVISIYNWVDTENVIPIDKNQNHLYEKFKLEKDRFYVVYAGNLGNAQDINVIINSAKILEDYKEIVFLIIGNGNQEELIKKKANDLKNVLYFPIQSYSETSNVYSLGDLCVLTCKKGFGQTAMPSKLWSILSSGSCILANFDRGTDVENLILKNDIGYFVESGDFLKMVEFIKKAYLNPEEVYRKGKNGRDLIVSEYSREKAIKHYKEQIESVIL